MSFTKRLPEIKLVDRLVQQIKPILAGHPPEIQGAVLCECTALWLAGFNPDRPPAERREKREEMLAFHDRYVRKMVATYDGVYALHMAKKKGGP